MKTDKHELFAVLGTADEDGIVAGMIPGLGASPLVSLSRGVVDRLMIAAAQAIADESGRPVELVRYTRAETLRTIRPRPRG